MFGKFILSNLKSYRRLPTLHVLVRNTHDKYEKYHKSLNAHKCQPIKMHSEPLKYKPLTMDDMLIPSGSWEEHYKKRNQRYNLLLVSSSLFFIASLIVLINSMDFNAIPPPYPFDEEVEAKDDDKDQDDYKDQDDNKDQDDKKDQDDNKDQDE